MRETGAHYMGLNLVPRVLSYPSLRNERETLVASGHVACVQTSPISFVARGKGPFSACNKGNRRRLHPGNWPRGSRTNLTLREESYKSDKITVNRQSYHLTEIFFSQFDSGLVAVLLSRVTCMYREEKRAELPCLSNAERVNE